MRGLLPNSQRFVLPMRHLLAATCLTPVIAFAFAAPASAQVVISTATTTPVRTSTIGTGGTSNDIRISSTGSIKPTASGNAVTIDSNENVTNEGTIQFTGVNDATGIYAAPGVTSTIINSGTITLDENYTPTDTDTDGDLDGPFAQGTGRFGIRTGGAMTGAITNGGTITIEGNNSAGIQLQGPLTGTLTNGGTITVNGNNGFGIHAMDDVSGRVTINGSIGVRGANSVGVALDGDVGGAVVFQGNVTATGYRSTAAPADVTKLDADDLLQGGPAVRISGNVAGGILFDIPPTDNSTTDTDEDDDGVVDTAEGASNITAYGAAPAVQIGSATEDITVGALAGTGNGGFGIVNRGIIASDAVYTGVAGNGVVIGGMGGDVTVTGGFHNAGAIAAVGYNANSRAVLIGNGATVSEVRNTGTIGSLGGGVAGTSAAGIYVDSGAHVNTISNRGRIEVTLRGTTANSGTAYGVADRSGSVTLVENSGVIAAVGTDVSNAVAIDVSANTSGVTVRQLAPSVASRPSRISGSLLFGSGNDTLEVQSGAVTGNTSFGAGNDSLIMSGSSSYVGDIDFGAGSGTLTLNGTSAFTGRLTNTANVNATVNGGSLLALNSQPVALNSLAVLGNGGIGVRIDPAGTTRYNVAGEASFAAGSKILLSLSQTAGAEGNYVVVDAGTLTGGSNIGLDTNVLPYLFVGSVSTNQAEGQVLVNVRRRTATELGLNRSESSAYNAVYAALSDNEDIEDVFLGLTSSAGVRNAVQQMLPEHAGGTFETVTQASRATARFLLDPRPPVIQQGSMGFFLQQVAWGTSKDLGDTSAYNVDGWGVNGGVEMRTGDTGAVGVSLAYMLGRDRDGTTDNEVTSSHYELAGYWRGQLGPVNAFVRGSAARIGFESTRTFSGTANNGEFELESRGSWGGTLLGASAGASYEIRSGRLSIRPVGSIDYYRLSEGNYTEEGGGEGFDLTVHSRNSSELAANAALSVGYDFGSTTPTGNWFRLELEGGRRQILSGGLGATTAQFGDGQTFVLSPEERQSGFTGRIRLLGGTQGFRIGGEVGAEEQSGHAAVSARVMLHATF